MYKTRITTDKKWKKFKDGYEVPQKIRKEYKKSAEDRWIKHYNNWYHLSDFMRTSGDLEERGWEGAMGDSWSHGTLIKVSRDGEEYMIGQYSLVSA